jgi:hypothetical protein
MIGGSDRAAISAASPVHVSAASEMHHAKASGLSGLSGSLSVGGSGLEMEMVTS